MSEQDEPMTALVPTSHREFFHEGTGIESYQIEDAWYIALRQICRSFDLDWSAQRQRIVRDPILSAGVVTVEVASSGGTQDTLALRSDLFWGWLFKIDLGRVSEEARAKLIPFQRAGYEALHRHFTGAGPVAPASDLEARIAALEARVGGGINTAHATPATPRPTHYTLPVAPSVQRMRVDHPSAVAILGVLRESAAPLSAKQVCLVLTERGQTTHDTKYFTVCLRRLECAGAVRRVAYGLYEAAQTIEIPPRLPEGRLMGWDD